MRIGHRRILAFTLMILVVGCTGTGAATAPTQRTAGPAVATAAPRSAEPLYDPAADARAEILAAIAAAKADGKLVLIDFGADWCPDCHVLSAYMHGPAGQALVDEAFHVVAVDVGRWDHNLDVAKSYGDAIWKGIPAVVVVDGDGEVVGSTADGSLASAASMSEEEVLAILAHLAE